jgi:hypothetical protein
MNKVYNERFAKTTARATAGAGVFRALVIHWK